MASSSGIPQHVPPTAGQSPQGSVDHQSRAPGSGYQGGPAATTGKGPPANIGTGRVEPPAPPPKETAGKAHNQVNLKV
jgi:hypothetical protein